LINTQDAPRNAEPSAIAALNKGYFFSSARRFKRSRSTINEGSVGIIGALFEGHFASDLGRNGKSFTNFLRALFDTSNRRGTCYSPRVRDVIIEILGLDRQTRLLI
jgi:hypothetical protein